MWQDEVCLADEVGKNASLSKWPKSPLNFEENLRKKEIEELKEEVNRLKRKQKQAIKDHEGALERVQMEEERRRSNLLRLLKEENVGVQLEEEERKKERREWRSENERLKKHVE